MRLLSLFALLLTFLPTVRGDGNGDNIPDNVRRIPPAPKVQIPDADKKGLLQDVDDLAREIESLKVFLKDKPNLLALLPDVQIYYNAVRFALNYDEIFDAKREVPIARKHLQSAYNRINSLKESKAPWTTQTGTVVRGYVSKIDGSVQPYGLVVPATYQANGSHKHRLDLWCHGRGETLSELNFINGPGSSSFVPDGFVLNLYGRYCNANKLAGEVDCFEALESVKKNYRIDESRLVMRGFSMGGAACWQFAVHYPSVWCAAAPGAGFAETAQFLKVFQNEKVEPTWYEKKLWHLYDCPDYAVNLFNLPTIAYSGEIDSQKQAADVMEKALKGEGIDLVHLIGPKTGHAYHLETKKELDRQINEIVEKGRDPLPKHVKFQTYTLRYNRSFWVAIDGMEKHWERARVDAELDGAGIKVTTTGVMALTLSLPSGASFEASKPVPVVIDGQTIAGPMGGASKNWQIHMVKTEKGWMVVYRLPAGLRKIHGLQGPIDDAFLDRFIVVKPTGQAMNESVGKWVNGEMTHAITHWRQQFRGEAIVKDDKAITDADIADSNLVLWGDPSSNAVLAKIADKLPIKWTKEGVTVGDEKFPSTNVPVMIYPNPLNPKRYVVLNSGFTYREYDYLNNARQVPKLPDFAIIDATTPMTSRLPGKVVAAGFFDEKWQLK
jgi:Prolyl oligopeptidase family